MGGERLLAELRGQGGRGVRLRVVTKPAQRNWLVEYRLKRLRVDVLGQDEPGRLPQQPTSRPTHKGIFDIPG